MDLRTTPSSWHVMDSSPSTSNKLKIVLHSSCSSGSSSAAMANILTYLKHGEKFEISRSYSNTSYLLTLQICYCIRLSHHIVLSIVWDADLSPRGYSYSARGGENASPASWNTGSLGPSKGQIGTKSLQT